MLKAKIKHQSFSSETLDIHPISFPQDLKKVTGESNSQNKLIYLIFKYYCKRFFTVHNTTQRSYGRIIVFSMGEMVI
jgi:hypothetical protein